MRNKWKKRSGEGYIDVCVLVVCAMLVLALAVRILPVFVAKQQLDTYAVELVREAEISGRVGTETSRRAAALTDSTGLDPNIRWSKTGRIQLNEEVTVTLTLDMDIGLFGGFAPAANAAAQAVHTGQLTPRQADALLPACVCSGPSFVVLTVGQTLLHSTELGILLFLAQLSAGYLTAALLNRLSRAEQPATCTAPPPEAPPPQLTDLLTHATMAYLKLCGFVLFFRMLAAGVGAVFPPAVGTVCAMLLEVCSGCDLAARTGPWGSLLCCAALSVQGLSVLLQVRALCPPEMTLRPLLAGRLLHLPLSVGLFWLLLPQGEQSVFSTLPPQVVPMRRLPPDCLLLVFFVCCLAVCQLTSLLQKPDPEPKETVVNRAER